MDVMQMHGSVICELLLSQHADFAVPDLLCGGAGTALGECGLAGECVYIDSKRYSFATL